MKKASTHVDWAISMGIFLIYILSLFIFLKPVVQEESKQEDLSLILLDGFNNDLRYEIDKIPLYIDYYGKDGKLVAEIDFSNEPFPFSGKDKDFALIEKSNNYLPFLKTSVIRFEYSLRFRKNQKYTFWLLYSKDMNYESSNYFPLPTEIPPQEEETKLAKNNIDFSYKFGIPETIKGISSTKLNNLPEYNTLKRRWKFPNTEEFSLAIYDSSTFKYTKNDEILSYNPNIIAQQTAVYTREFKDFILEPNTALTPIIINFRFGKFLIQNE